MNTQNGIGEGSACNALLSCFDFNDLLMSSTAYYLGRRTISVDDFCCRLIKAWPLLPDGVKHYVERIVEAEFAKETLVRQFQWDWTPFGDNCDRESWLNVRRCWSR